MANSENKIVQFFETLNSIPMPDWVKKNILLALGKGIGKVIVSGLDWPAAWFEVKARELRAKASGNETVQQEAAKQVASLFASDNELANRAINFYAQNMIETQINREDIALKAIDNLPKEIPNAESESEIDTDWLKQFWSISENKSKENVKLILGKILAKEIVRPNSISLNTIQLMTNFTADLGNSFRKLCNLSIKNGSFVFVIHPNIEAFMNCGELKDYEISFSDQTEFECLGLIRSINVTSLEIYPDNKEPYLNCDYAGKKVKCNFSKGVKVIDFTPAGKEIRDLFDLEQNPKYTEYLLSLGEDQFKFA